jgi:hypothetical protein
MELARLLKHSPLSRDRIQFLLCRPPLSLFLRSFVRFPLFLDARGCFKIHPPLLKQLPLSRKVSSCSIERRPIRSQFRTRLLQFFIPSIKNLLPLRRQLLQLPQLRLALRELSLQPREIVVAPQRRIETLRRAPFRCKDFLLLVSERDITRMEASTFLLEDLTRLLNSLKLRADELSIGGKRVTAQCGRRG